MEFAFSWTKRGLKASESWCFCEGFSGDLNVFALVSQRFSSLDLRPGRLEQIDRRMLELAEDHVKRFLTEKRLSVFKAFLAKERAKDFMDEKLYAMKDFLEKDYAIECIFLMYLEKGRWVRAKEFTVSTGRPISEGAYRARMIELERRGLVSQARLRDPVKKHYCPTEFGRSIATLLLELFERLEKQGLL